MDEEKNTFLQYSHLSNNRGGWNKRGGSAKVAKSINVEGGIFWKKLVQYTLDLRKILGVAKKSLKSRSFLFQTLQNP